MREPARARAGRVAAGVALDGRAFTYVAPPSYDASGARGSADALAASAVRVVFARARGTRGCRSRTRGSTRASARARASTRAFDDDDAHPVGDEDGFGATHAERGGQETDRWRRARASS